MRCPSASLDLGCQASSGSSFATALSWRDCDKWASAWSRCATPDDQEPQEQVSTTARASDCDVSLRHYPALARFDRLSSEGHFARVGILGECIGGQVELNGWQAEEVCQLVAVKRARSTEEIQNEVGIYCLLSEQQEVPQYILKMHLAFELGSDVCLVLEYADGGDLFTVCKGLKREGSEMPKEVMRWTWQLLQALQYLHDLNIGHRDVSLENVLLCHGDVRVMDFGTSVRTHDSSGGLLRYFRTVGKPYYRSPECYVPEQAAVDVLPPAGSRPGKVCLACGNCGGQEFLTEVLLPAAVLPNEACTAKPCGYAVPPVDVFACGVCLFVLATGSPPFRQATLSDPHFKWLHANGVAKVVETWRAPVAGEALDLLTWMLQPNPARRPTMKECLEHPWLAGLRSEPVPVRFAEGVRRESTCLEDPWHLPLGFDLLGLPLGPSCSSEPALLEVGALTA